MCAANMQMIRVPNYVHELVCHLISCNTCCPDTQTRRQKGTIHVCLYCRYVYVCMCVRVCMCLEVCARTHVSVILLCHIGLLCKRALQKRLDSAKKTCNCVHELMCEEILLCHVSLRFTQQCCRDSWVIMCTNMTQHKSVAQIHITLSHKSVQQIHITL